VVVEVERMVVVMVDPLEDQVVVRLLMPLQEVVILLQQVRHKVMMVVKHPEEQMVVGVVVLQEQEQAQVQQEQEHLTILQVALYAMLVVELVRHVVQQEVLIPALVDKVEVLMLMAEQAVQEPYF
jgi:hypothetical protein